MENGVYRPVSPNAILPRRRVGFGDIQAEGVRRIADIAAIARAQDRIIAGERSLEVRKEEGKGVMLTLQDFFWARGINKKGPMFRGRPSTRPADYDSVLGLRDLEVGL